MQSAGLATEQEGKTQLNYDVMRQNVLDEIQHPLKEPRQTKSSKATRLSETPKTTSSSPFPITSVTSWCTTRESPIPRPFKPILKDTKLPRTFKQNGTLTVPRLDFELLRMGCAVLTLRVQAPTFPLVKQKEKSGIKSFFSTWCLLSDLSPRSPFSLRGLRFPTKNHVTSVHLSPRSLFPTGPRFPQNHVTSVRPDVPSGSSPPIRRPD